MPGWCGDRSRYRSFAVRIVRRAPPLICGQLDLWSVDLWSLEAQECHGISCNENGASFLSNPPTFPASSAAAAVATAPAPTKQVIPTPALLLAMLQVGARVSDLIFSPSSLPHVEVSGQLVPVKIAGLQALSAEDTHRIACELIGNNQQAMAALQQQGSCDISYSLPGHCRFRVNIFMQRGSHAIVMRVIPKTAPTFADLNLPKQLMEIANLKNGVVLVTGPTGSGKSSTMAA